MVRERRETNEGNLRITPAYCLSRLQGDRAQEEPDSHSEWRSSCRSREVKVHRIHRADTTVQIEASGN